MSGKSQESASIQIKEKSTIEEKASKEEFLPLVEQALSCGIQAEFLKSQKDSKFTEEELSEFFWSVVRKAYPEKNLNFDKKILDTVYAKNLMIEDLEASITDAALSGKKKFLVGCPKEWFSATSDFYDVLEDLGLTKEV